MTLPQSNDCDDNQRKSQECHTFIRQCKKYGDYYENNAMPHFEWLIEHKYRHSEPHEREGEVILADCHKTCV